MSQLFQDLRRSIDMIKLPQSPIMTKQQIKKSLNIGIIETTIGTQRPRDGFQVNGDMEVRDYRQEQLKKG